MTLVWLAGPETCKALSLICTMDTEIELFLKISLNVMVTLIGEVLFEGLLLRKGWYGAFGDLAVPETTGDRRSADQN